MHSPAISILAGHCHPCPMLPLPPPHTTAHNTFVVHVSVGCCKLFRIFSTNLVYGGMALARSDVCGSAFEDMDRTKHRLSFMIDTSAFVKEPAIAHFHNLHIYL